MAKVRRPKPLPPQVESSFPLTDEHYGVLDAVCQDAALCGQVLAKVRAAGYDVSEYEAINQRQAELAAGLKREFFPHRA